jgi:hypothetical protein
MADHHRRQPRPSTRREVLGPGESRANIDEEVHDPQRHLKCLRPHPSLTTRRSLQTAPWMYAQAVPPPRHRARRTCLRLRPSPSEPANAIRRYQTVQPPRGQVARASLADGNLERQSARVAALLFAWSDTKTQARLAPQRSSPGRWLKRFVLKV